MAGGGARPDATLYRVVADDLRRDIEARTLPPGAELPTEKELAARYGVSRNTVRLAYAELADAGLVVSAQGRGRRVREHVMVTHHLSQIESLDTRIAASTDAFVDDMRAQQKMPSQHIEAVLVPAPDFVAERLEVDEGAIVVVRRRLRRVDGEPSSIADSYYPRDVAEGTEIINPADVSHGVIRLLAERGLPQTRYLDELSARMPTRDESIRLGIAGRGMPVLVQLRTGYSADRPVRLTVTIMPGDRNQLVYELPG